ncbi:hypothetical protein J6590_074940 [Homalodisca vitripennis]|nr:hypothetical protein J6590_074940 [Homalodisca vitripennis]
MEVHKLAYSLKVNYKIFSGPIGSKTTEPYGAMLRAKAIPTQQLWSNKLLSCDVTSRHYPTTNGPSWPASQSTQSPPPDTVM